MYENPSSYIHTQIRTIRHFVHTDVFQFFQIWKTTHDSFYFKE